MENIAWNIDANNIRLNDLDVDNIRKYVVFTKEIEDFLDISENNNKLFIIGPKGLGKTLILKIKSQLYRNTYPGYKFIPQDRLCERFTKVGVSLSQKDLNKFNNREVWDKVWQFCILCLILRRFNKQLPPEIRSHLGYATDLSEILTAMLQSRGAIEKLYHYISTHLRPQVRELRKEGINQVAIFIDNIDEGFDHHTGYSLKHPGSGASGLSEHVWVHAQNSIVQVARNLCANLKHLKIFISIRSEAYQTNKDSTKLQLDDNACALNYSKEEIKKIFVQNISSTHPSLLHKSKDPMSRITGYNKITHPFIENGNGEKIKENLFDFIYRHTYGRPRELVIMGKRLINELHVDARSEDAVKDIVNKVSYDLFDQLKNEMIPYFEDEVFETFCKHVKSNVIELGVAKEVSSKIEEHWKFKDVFSYFYRIGLLGFVDKDYEGFMKQKFLPVGHYALSTALVPEYEYFVLHPSLNDEMKRHHHIKFYNKINIIGSNYPFKLTKDNRRSKHLHFGLDRNSLSIVIPELSKCKCLAIIQEPNQQWSVLKQHTHIIFSYNNGEEYTFNIFHDDLPKVEKTSLFNKLQTECSPTIFYTSDMTYIHTILAKCETLSFCDIPEKIFSQMDALNLQDKFIYYPDRIIKPSTITRINEMLSKFSGQCTPVLIDKLLYDITSAPSEDGLFYNLNVEEYGTLVCPERNNAAMQPSATIIRTKSDEEFKFYLLRQHYLVEGIYQFYKFLKQKNTSDISEETPDDLFMLFIHLQVSRITKTISGKTLRAIFQHLSQSEIFDKLVYFSLQTYQRLNTLSKNYYTTGNYNALNRLKEEGFIPTDEDFYNFVSHSKYISKHQNIIKLQSVLNVNKKESLRSVFISYSFKDMIFAQNIADFLMLNGVKVFLFQIDDPYNSLKEIMSKEINKHERIIFVTSKNSLRSEACQYELSQCRKKHRKTWDNVIIPIRVDNYIFELEEHHIPAEFREEFWKNIQFIRENNVNDYSNFVHDFDAHAFQNEKIKILIEQSLQKEKSTQV